MLEPGQTAPAFELPDADMNVVTLEQYRGERNVILYFYPRDDAPGCTIEAIEFSELEDDFNREGAVVVGVSMDDCMSHGTFRDKHGLSVQLLADTEGDACRCYDVIYEKEMEGRKKTGIRRSTFIIDRNGVLKYALYGVTARGHAAEVLNLVKGLS